MTIEAIKKVMYRCSECGAEYDKRQEADQNCGSFKTEPAIFKKGDRVSVWYVGKRREGTVIKVIGPVIGNSCKNGKRRFGVGAHVYQYEVAIPRGKGTSYAVFWTSELTKG